MWLAVPQRNYNPESNYLDYMPDGANEDHELVNATTPKGDFTEYKSDINYGYAYNPLEFEDYESYPNPTRNNDVVEPKPEQKTEKSKNNNISMKIPKSIVDSYKGNESIWLIVVIIILILLFK
jgi:hypothetical protein